jgi:23S rRNA (guanine745-N1)-methyltransferase
VSDPTAPPAFRAGVLRCPHHGRSAGGSASDDHALRLDGRSLSCRDGHRFDLAAQGYVNLLDRAAPAAADTAGMVAARVEVQAAGLQDELTAALTEVVTDALAHPPWVDAQPAATAPAPGRRPLIVDLGAGTGHHLAAVLDACAPDVPAAGVAVDISKYAARRAARVHPGLAAIVADVWGPIPVGDACADVVLTVFAPRNSVEVARILRPGGYLIVATPDADHLHPLVDRLGLLQVGGDKLDRLDADLETIADRVERTRVHTTRRLGHDLVRAVIAMGPSAHHLDADLIEGRLTDLPDPVEVTSAFVVSTYRRR